MKLLYSIQILRGIGVLLVMLYHIRKYLNINEALPLGNILFDNAAIAVDIFFVISGVIIVYSTQYIQGSFKEVIHFCIKRLFRIVPLYILVTLVHLWSTEYFQGPNTTTASEYLWNSLLFLPQSLGGNGGDSAPFYGYATLIVGWTLIYEMYFYAIYAISLLFQKYQWYFLALYFLVTLLIIPAWYKDLHFEANYNYYFEYSYLNIMTNPIIWDFIFGMIIAWCYIKIQDTSWSKNLGHPLMLFAVTSFALWQYISGWNYGHGPLGWGILASMLVFVSMMYERWNTLTFSPILLFLGNISYSLYLWHIPVQLYLPKFLQMISGSDYFVTPSQWIYTSAASVLIASLSYSYLEIGLFHYLSKKITSSHRGGLHPLT